MASEAIAADDTGMNRPNLLLIVIDDLGWRDLTCYGSTFYETPNLDRLAAGGMRFTDAYASCPVCSPTRASLMSGKHPARLGITQYINHDEQGRVFGARRIGRLEEAPYLHYLPRTEVSIAAALREGGYQTWHVGKWHLGDDEFFPEKHGFDVNIGGCAWGMPKQGYWSPWNIPGLDNTAPGTYLTDHITDRALDVLSRRDRSRPFFMNLCHYAVHTPIQAPPALVEKYRRKAKALGLDRAQAIVTGEEMPVLPASWEPQGQMGRVQRRVLQSDCDYAAMIENLDTNIGRVLDALEREGLAEDTLVVFTSDNGGLSTAEGSPTCNAPLAEGKGWYREGGTRVCQIARWPARVRAGQVSSTPVQSCDIYPTFLAAAGLPPRPEQHRDGVSILPVLDGGGLEARALFWHFPHYANQGGQPAAWVLRDGWKLIHHYERGRDELIRLSEDISEARDVVGEFPEVARALRQELDAWQRDVEAKHPSPNPEFERLRRMVPRVANNAAV
jgi:arylsulfatase A-like enzyme